LGLEPGADRRDVLAKLVSLTFAETTVIGLGTPLVGAPGRLPELRAFPAIVAPGAVFPSTQGALWAFFAGHDPGEALHRARALVTALGAGLRVEEDVSAFKYAEGRDLSGYEDGTENPKGDEAIEAALVQGSGPGRDGSSFVATQRWVHHHGKLEAMSQEARDHVIGRRQSDNEELEDAPEDAHVKRSAQESFTPEAFVVRRSMPYGTVTENGLYFVAYGRSLDAFERILKRMAGLEDGTTDALLRFTRAVSGGYYWCPPRGEDGRLDLSALTP
jgi:putative iron-dependent peroxidase